MKLRRAREKNRKRRQKEEEALFGEVDALYTDGKKDSTAVITDIEVGGETRPYKSIVLEEHYVVVGEPGNIIIMFYIFTVYYSNQILCLP